MRWFGSLCRSGEIAHVRRRGRTVNAATISLSVLGDRPDALRTRIAVTVSKQVGGAVVRNRVKRRIKGALDTLGAPRTPVRLVIVARPAAAAAPYARIANDLAASLGPLSRAP